MSRRVTEYRNWRSIDYRPALSELPAEHLAPYLHSGQRALEIGCNRGRTAVWLASRGVEIVGIDINSDAISHAREETKKVVNVKAHFLEGDFLDQPNMGHLNWS